MQTIQLKNHALSITLKSTGAELTSILDSNDVQYLWQGDPAYWSGQAPILFPIVGCLRNSIASIAGDKTCHFGRHGLARHEEFQILNQTDTSVTFVLKANDETKKQYPFDFELQIVYTLTKRGVQITHNILNHDSNPMPYFVGGHPAFCCPLFEGESFEDYIIEFEQPETAHCAQLDEDGLIMNHQRISILEDASVLPLKHALFYKDALIFDQLISRRACLKHTKTGKGICVSFPDFDYLGIWSSANDGPFVAIEPWSGTTTCSDEDDVFEHKRGVRILNPEERDCLSYTIEII